MALVGTIRVPSDKSISHRAVLFSGMAQGTSQVRNLLPSDDVLCSLAAIRALGADVQVAEGPHGLNGTVRGFGGEPERGRELDIDCGNSGTTTRLLLGLLSGLKVQAHLHGDASLSGRPMERVMKPLRLMGARFESEDGCLPVRVLPAPGSGLKALSYESPHASAQVKSAVLLAGLFADGTTTVAEPAKSRDHTELMLPAYGVPVQVDGLRVSVRGPVQLQAHDVNAPADPSSAAFVAVAAALCPGSDVALEQVALNPTRTGAFRVMERMGAELSYENTSVLGAEPVGDVHVRYSPGLVGTEVAAGEIPSLIDEIPILALLAAGANGRTVFRSAGELRVKECDRFAAIRHGLACLGVETLEEGDDLHVMGAGLGNAPEVLTLPSHGDHRMAMTWHLAGLASGKDVRVDDPACVSVSWPGFYNDIATLTQQSTR